MDNSMRAFMPIDLVVFLSFFSPIILAACLLWLSFVNNNLKGFIYIGILLFHCMIRNFIYMFYGTPETFFNPLQFRPSSPPPASQLTIAAQLQANLKPLY